MSFSAIFSTRNTSNKYELCPAVTVTATAAFNSDSDEGGVLGAWQTSEFQPEYAVTVASAHSHSHTHFILLSLSLSSSASSCFFLLLLKPFARPPTAIYICHKREMTLENVISLSRDTLYEKAT